MIPGHLEDIYPLAPLQQGLLFHTVAAPDSTVYMEQMSWIFEGALDVEAYRQAWQGVVDRHSILRTGFVWQGLEAPVQVVFRQATVPFREEDWRGLDAAELQARLDQLREDEIRQRFDLVTAPLLRQAVIRLQDDTWACVWTWHHILLDGWSISLVLGEMLARYRTLRQGDTPDFPAAPRFRGFLAWQQRQDSADAERYWRSALRGISRPTTLTIGAAGRPDQTASAAVEHQSWIAEGLMERLQGLARRERVTLNTIFQGAWALLLSRYTGETDVMFGSTVSVRPPDVPNIEEMAGLLINAVPVRTQVSPDTPLVTWLRELQSQQARARGYGHVPLTQVHRWSEVPRDRPLFETLFIFENFPINLADREASELDLTIRDVQGVTRPNYPLNLMIHPGQRALVRYIYDPSHFDEATIERMAGHMEVLLAGMAEIGRAHV
jgi:hypothetical protein